jgi:uncharacterized membrane protein YhaH (DUF805 family)
MFNYYISVLKKYAVFSGRARRKEYWYFVLGNFLIAFIIGIIQGYVGEGGFNSEENNIILNIFQLAILTPSIAVSVRRMHDVNKSGWFILVPIYNLILSLTDGTMGDNKYGPDPKVVGIEQI